jgi:hypothetical protein
LGPFFPFIHGKNGGAHVCTIVVVVVYRVQPGYTGILKNIPVGYGINVFILREILGKCVFLV